MQDRVPLYPGRVTMTPVEGQANTYDMVRADQPTQAGTPLSKANLLKDTTAAQFGLGAGAVPDDVLSWLGKYNEYWWSLLHQFGSYQIKNGNTYPSASGYSHSGPILFEVNGSSGEPNTILSVADSVSINESGAISLVSPTQYTYPAGSDYSFNSVNNHPQDSMRGKYCMLSIATESVAANEIFYVPPDASYYFYAWEIQFSVGYPVQSVYISQDTITYEHSMNRNAYPDSGTVDGVTYTYLGVPFEKMPRIANIMTGVYTGTGVGGSGFPNIINTPFAAQMIFIQKNPSSINQVSLFATDTSPTGVFYGTVRSTDGYSDVTANNTFTFSSDSVSWYLSSASMSLSYFTDEGKATAQLNSANTSYRYLIIG